MSKNLIFLILSILVGSVSFAELPLDDETKLSEEYVNKMSQEENTVVIEEGVVLREIYKSDSLATPGFEDKVKVIYHGIDRQGVVFDSSLNRDEATTFPIDRLIPCWQIAMPKVSVGSVYKITCPAATAYGDKGAGTAVKPGAALTFRVVLLEIISK